MNSYAFLGTNLLASKTNICCVIALGTRRSTQEELDSSRQSVVSAPRDRIARLGKHASTAG